MSSEPTTPRNETAEAEPRPEAEHTSDDEDSDAESDAGSTSGDEPDPNEVRVLTELSRTVDRLEMEEQLLIAKNVIRTMQTDPAYIQASATRYAARESVGPEQCAWCRVGIEDANLFRCHQRGCHHQLPACDVCIRIAHEQNPTHRIEEWVDNRWQRRTLRDVGFIHQLGHEGLPCPNPSIVLTVRLINLADGVQELWCRECLCST
ncbi:hypothetical protein B0H11DRAFT_2237968 [Mycena galericulata]|nr:hypothetical protein B0H11DRAFT_2237968 [Mycena galericulata]